MARGLVVPTLTSVPTRPRRRGVALVELLVAFPLIALLGTVAVVVLLATLRLARQDDGQVGALRELHAASLTLRTELQRLRPDELMAWRDTLLEFDTLVGLASVCAVDGSTGTVTVVAPDPTALPHTLLNPAAATWHDPPQPGDLLTHWTAPSAEASPAAPPVPVTGRIRSVAAGTGCATAPLSTNTRSLRLEFTPAAAHPLVPRLGSPVRLTRRIRYSLYRGTDGLWYLGRRALSPSGWDIVQPVAGPLATPAEGGMRVTVRDRRDQIVLAPPTPVRDAATPAVVQITLRAPRRTATTTGTGTTVDSVRLTVAFRSHPTLEPR